MYDSSSSKITLPAPAGPIRKMLWFLIVLAAILALIILTAWECKVVVTEQSCKHQLPTLSVKAGDISVSACPVGSNQQYRCVPQMQKFRAFFGRGGT
jgi:hypothetical protein